MERWKNKLQLWKKAVFHFLLCFTMGFFAGFIPTGYKSWTFFNHDVATTQSEFSPQSLEIPSYHNLNPAVLMRSNESSHPGTLKQEQAQELGIDKLNSRRLLIIVTPTSVKNHLRGVLLMRLANTLKLVPPPLLWMVVQPQSDSYHYIDMLCQTLIISGAFIWCRVFGTWAMAFLWANRESVIIQGPACDSSEVIGMAFQETEEW